MAEVGPERKQSREEVLAQIERAREETLADNGVNVEDIREDRAAERAAADGDDEAKKKAEPEPEPAPEPEPDPTAVKEPAAEPAPLEARIADDEALTTVVIDGVEQQVKVKDLRANYQIDGAARQRLADAGRILREAQALRDTPAPKADATPKPEAADDDLKGADFKALAKTIQFGEPDEVAEALRQTVLNLRAEGQKRRQPAQSYEEIEARVLDKIEMKTAVAAFGSEFADILASDFTSRWAGDLAHHMTVRETEDSKREGRQRKPLADIYRAAGLLVRAEAARLNTANAPRDPADPDPKPKPSNQPKVDVSNDRDGRKRQASASPAPRGGISRTPKAESAPEISESERRSAAINEMLTQRQQHRGIRT